ncbi:MAG: response regulator [Bacteroidetes bacterium]|nr:response regulator [Bacteroidota bacterium]
MSSKKIKCLVVDDEKLARLLLTGYIKRLPQLELVASCKDALEAQALLEQIPADLLFLDIQMPGLTGIEFLNALPQKPLVVLTTAYEKYALEGYQLDVVDYLLKPFRFERFAQAVAKSERRLAQDASPAVENPFLLVKSSHTVHKVFLDEIMYIKGMKEYVSYHLADRRIISLQTMKQLEKELPGDQFVRIHKSYIISIPKITALDGGHVYIGQTKLPIGGSYKEAVAQSIPIQR